MNVEEFFQQLNEMRSHRRAIMPMPLHSGSLPEELEEVFEEIRIAFEELKVAQELLYDQNEKLRQKNEELETARRLLESESLRYQELFNEAPDGYLVTDLEGTIQEANRAALTLLNVSQRFIIGKSVFNFIVEQERSVFQSKLIKPRQGDWVREWEVRLFPNRLPPIEVAVTVAVVRDQEYKPIALRWLLRDITEFKRAEEQQLHNAFHDVLTGLPNRALFMSRLERAVSVSKHLENYLFAVLFLDLDRFKVINDSLGHIFGDKLLSAIALRLCSVLESNISLYRLGGDEFTILLEELKDISEALKVTEQIQAELRLPFVIDSQEIFTTASIGIASSVIGYDRPEDILRDADIATYRAKSLGGGRYEMFNTDMHVQAVARLQLETALRQALCRSELRIHYQPIVSLQTGLIHGFEALVRWQHPKLGLLSPSEFIQVAQETEIGISIDRLVLAAACRQTHQWQKQYPSHPPKTISVNISRWEFAHPDLIEHIYQVLQETNLDAQSLNLELTESVIIENSLLATQRLEQLKQLGIQLSIDDFGTGYSSLSRLHHFPINMLKIDRSFVSRMGFERGNLEIVEMLVTLAQKLGVEVIAEGVETLEQLEKLRYLKCEYGQGYFFSPPLETSAAEALIVSEAKW